MSLVTRARFIRTVIAFVNDADFYIGGLFTLKEYNK